MIEALRLIFKSVVLLWEKIGDQVTHVQASLFAGFSAHAWEVVVCAASACSVSRIDDSPDIVIANVFELYRLAPEGATSEQP